MATKKRKPVTGKNPLFKEFLKNFSSLAGNLNNIYIRKKGSTDFVKIDVPAYKGRFSELAMKVYNILTDIEGGMGDVEIFFEEKKTVKPQKKRVKRVIDDLKRFSDFKGRHIGAKTAKPDTIKQVLVPSAKDRLLENLRLATRRQLSEVDPKQLAEHALVIDPKWAKRELERKNGDIEAFGKEVAYKLSEKLNKISLDAKTEDVKRWTDLAIVLSARDPEWKRIEGYADFAGKLKRLLIKPKTDKSANQIIGDVQAELANKKIKWLKQTKVGSKILNKLYQKEPRLKDPLVLKDFLSSKDAEDIIQKLMVIMYKGKELTKKDLETAESYFKIPAPWTDIEKHEHIEELSNKLDKKTTINAKKALAAAIYGEPGNYNQFLTRKLFPYIQDEEFRKKAEEFTKRGDFDSLREYVRQRLKGKTFSYSELQQILGTDKIRQDVLNKLESIGVKVMGGPQEINVSSTGAGKRESGVGKSIFSSSGTGVAKKKSAGLFGTSKVVWSPKGPRLKEYAGAISYTRLKGVVAGRKKHKQQQRLAEYKELELNKVATPEELKVAASSSFLTRKLKEAQFKKRLTNPAYYKEQLRKRMEKEQKADVAAAVALKEYERKMRAVKSPFYGAWYRMAKKTKILLALVLGVAILFLPVGLFYVAGWAFAVGIAFLISLVAWVFMEIWNLIARGIVAFISLVGQGIAGVFNYIGNSVAGWFGMSFTQFQFRLAESMNINVGEGTGFIWGTWNLVPPSFMRLEHFMPTTFDTDTILAKIYPPLAGFFRLVYDPIAQRYLNWIGSAEWYYVGAIIGVPLVLIVVGLFLFVRHLSKKWRGIA